MTLVDCHLEGCPWCLYHICQGYYIILNDINFYRVEPEIFCNCVDETRRGVESEVLKNVGESTIAKIIELEDDE